jgi:hypothetical protein
VRRLFAHGWRILGMYHVELNDTFSATPEKHTEWRVVAEK